MIYSSFCLMDTDFNQEDFLNREVLKWMRKNSYHAWSPRRLDSEGCVIILGKEWNQVDIHASSWPVGSLESWLKRHNVEEQLLLEQFSPCRWDRGGDIWLDQRYCPFQRYRQ